MSYGRQMLGTTVVGLVCNIVAHKGELYMDEGCCCDMAACIEFFKTIDPSIDYIETFAGAEPDTIYVFTNDDRWHALCQRAESTHGQ